MATAPAVPPAARPWACAPRSRCSSAAPRKKRSEPAFLPGQARGLDAVADAELADGLGQVVAHGALREVQRRGDLAGAAALARQAQYLALAFVERVRFRPGFQRQLRIDRPAAFVHAAQRGGQLL